MNDLKIFENPEFGRIRALERDGEPWFVAADVCRYLEIKNSRDALSRLDDDEKGVVSTDTPGGKQTLNIVNEYGLYVLVLGSRKKEAKAFKRWITHEVIPSIRKTGGYMTPAAEERLLAEFQKLADRVTALEDAVTNPFGPVPSQALPAPPPENPPPVIPGIAAKKRWMRTAGEKLDLMKARFNLSNNKVLHQVYQWIEKTYGISLEDRRLEIMEEQDLEECSTLAAIFYDPELRNYFEDYIDYNLAPENRGW